MLTNNKFGQKNKFAKKLGQKINLTKKLWSKIKFGKKINWQKNLTKI